MQQRASSLEQGIVTTSCQCCVNCTGFLSDKTWPSNSHAWCTSCYLFTHLNNWLTKSFPLKATVASITCLTPGHVLPHSHSSFGDRSISAATLCVWLVEQTAISLVQIRYWQADSSYNDFESQLKTYSLRKTALQHIVTFVFNHCATSNLTYLLTDLHIIVTVSQRRQQTAHECDKRLTSKTNKLQANELTLAGTCLRHCCWWLCFTFQQWHFLCDFLKYHLSHHMHSILNWSMWKWLMSNFIMILP